MKSLKTLLIVVLYITIFMFLFLFLSLIGILWLDYKTVITNSGWFIAYTMLIGWWIPALVLNEEIDKL